MINAKEAREIYDASGAEADHMLNRYIEPAVKAAAEAGKAFVFFYIDAEEVGRTITPTPVHKQVIDKLTALGYRVTFGRDNSHQYVPRGLADDDGMGPIYSNYGLTIGW